jgi:glycine/D-amino acid oxidase-like deaminating enzyme
MEGSINPKAVVIGGGLVGLIAAALLARGGKAALMEYVVAPLDSLLLPL